MTEISSWGRSLTGHYHDPSDWPKFDETWKADVFRYVSLCLTEGVPFAFRDQPILFQRLRDKLAYRLGINSKSITLTGSARSGFSYVPGQFGRAYNPQKSDLDLFLVSKEWFARLESDFLLFVSRYQAGLALPKNPTEASYFEINATETPRDLKRGFIDQWKIPNKDRYQYARAMYCAAYSFRYNLNSEAGIPIRKVSIRVYDRWESAISQIGGSLLSCLKARP